MPWADVEALTMRNLPYLQEGETLSGTDRSHRRSSMAGSVDSQQRSPTNHVDPEASPAGMQSNLHTPRHMPDASQHMWTTSVAS